ncbi:iron-containing alcohol dehydrogenase [Vagococcus coleopterorum]|uniref:Iron-containing alcohol dehydrogenase n=1 Tax=Vagococcus coleopterorum TaxID=2714946 RepID=A0A6G8AM08_9ENTE|nr:iron-containing alcohol dehydrogenase [Vagococcus coleopterorum]QIL45965.1 iron-containing alcohol dehydrogenase [Vagococcus coleopterorum]
MENFNFYVPTHVCFGEGQIKQLTTVLKPYGKKVLMVYGGGSIKKNGIYDDAVSRMKADNFEIIELAGVEPNPRIDTVRRGVEMCRENNIEVILAVGGGSTIDCSKAIAAGVKYEGDPWDFTKDRSLVKDALPLVTILTMAATGSEMNMGSVITNLETNEKLATGGVAMIPKASILDPTYTYTVNKWQTAAGSADILSHLFECYFTVNEGAAVQNRIAEGLMKTVLEYAPIALTDPTNYEARSNLMWSSSLALNGLTRLGKKGVWSCHPIEHELSAFYDITHGIGLAIITPSWMRYILSEQTVEKFVSFAENVWDIDSNNRDPFDVANEGIDKLVESFKSWGIPMTLAEVGIDHEKIRLMSELAVKHSTISEDAFVALNADDVEKILLACM